MELSNFRNYVNELLGQTFIKKIVEKEDGVMIEFKSGEKHFLTFKK